MAYRPVFSPRGTLDYAFSYDGQAACHPKLYAKDEVTQGEEQMRGSSPIVIPEINAHCGIVRDPRVRAVSRRGKERYGGLGVTG